MGFLFAAAPYIVFAVADRLIGARDGMVAAGAFSVALLLSNWAAFGRPKVLDIATAILLGGLAVNALLYGPSSIVETYLTH